MPQLVLAENRAGRP